MSNLSPVHLHPSALEARIESLERQLEAERGSSAELRRLLAAALERIPPQLEAPSEPREAPRRPRCKRQSSSTASSRGTPAGVLAAALRLLMRAQTLVCSAGTQPQAPFTVRYSGCRYPHSGAGCHKEPRRWRRNLSVPAEGKGRPTANQEGYRLNLYGENALESRRGEVSA